MTNDDLKTRFSVSGELLARALSSFAVLGALAACSIASSTDIKTSGIYASINASADGTGNTAVSATLTVGQSLTYVELGVGDLLTASSGTESHTMSKTSLFSVVTYNATLTGDEEGKSATVAFKRASTDVSAPNTVVTLPAKFQITGPAAGTTFVRGKDAITVTWDNSGKADPLSVSLAGSCITQVSRTAASDSGTLVIAAEDIVASSGNEAKTCELTLGVTRTRTGTLDAAYGKGGKAVASQARHVLIKSGP